MRIIQATSPVMAIAITMSTDTIMTMGTATLTIMAG